MRAHITSPYFVLLVVFLSLSTLSVIINSCMYTKLYRFGLSPCVLPDGTAAVYKKVLPNTPSAMHESTECVLDLKYYSPCGCSVIISSRCVQHEHQRSAGIRGNRKRKMEKITECDVNRQNKMCVVCARFHGASCSSASARGEHIKVPGERATEKTPWRSSVQTGSR